MRGDIVNLKQLWLRNNACFIEGRTIDVRGIMVHSTGANNPNLRRYVGPDDGHLGHNPNNNHWNNYHPEGRVMGPHPWVNSGGRCRECNGRQVAVHAFIGRLANGDVATYQTLPWDVRGWHSGGAANDTHIGFEICEDGLADRAYIESVYREAVGLCVHLCTMFNLDPLADGVLIDHSEGGRRGIASNSADVGHWFGRHGKSMDAFRRDVKEALDGKADIALATVGIGEADYRAVTDSDEAIAVLAKAGIITDAAYWRNVISKGKVRFLDELMINMANAIVDG